MQVKTMKLANKQLSKSEQEDARKLVEVLEMKLLDLKGKRREEAIKAYRKLLLPSADQPIYFMRS
jgi:hypothetical protein